MSKTTSMTRVGLLAVLLAMVGFSYSLATSNSDSVATDGAAVRSVGTLIPLDFANPFVTASTDRDLGDAVAGSALTRLVRAKGGVPPYTFTAGTLTAFSQNTLQLLSNGILTTVGTAVAKNLPSPFRFSVTVKDSFGTTPHTKTETFRLTFLNSTLFRFANSSLADGTQFTGYSDQFAAVNGKGPYTFAVTSVTGAATSLSAAGLSLSPDGTVFGVPIVKGTLTIVATATDANSKKAAGRSGTGTSQTFTLNIGAAASQSSVLTATSITIKSGNGKDNKGVGKDGVSYKGSVNLGTEAIASLSGKSLSLRIGPYVAPTASFDGKGNALTAKGLVPAVKASVKKGGVFSDSISKDTIALGTITGTSVVLAVEARIGDAIIGSEVLTFAVKAGKNGAVTLTYKLGTNANIGGTNQLLKVTGADDKNGTGDAWKVSFVRLSPVGVSFNAITSAVVNIGNSYSNTITLAAKGTKLSGKGDSKSPVVSAYSLDTLKGKGSFTTGTVPTSQTGILQASKATGTGSFSTSTTLKAGATSTLPGESAIGIVPNKTKYSSQ